MSSRENKTANMWLITKVTEFADHILQEEKNASKELPKH